MVCLELFGDAASRGDTADPIWWRRERSTDFVELTDEDVAELRAELSVRGRDVTRRVNG